MDIGIDYAWSRPSVAAIQAYGAKFVCRYLSKDTSKNLQPAERRALLAAGIDIVLCYEDESGGPRQGYAHGQSDGARAKLQARAHGAPAGMVIYFAVDFDAAESDQDEIDAYLRGAASALGGTYQAGIYGGYYPVRRSLDAGVVRYAWQTYAWSGGQWDPRAQLRQVKNGINVGGANCDRDERHAPAGAWLDVQNGGSVDPRIERNLTAETDALINGAERVDQEDITTGQPAPKPVVPNVRLRRIAQALGLDDGDGPAEPIVFGSGMTDAQVTGLADRLAQVLGPLLAGAIQAAAESGARRALAAVDGVRLAPPSSADDGS